MFAGQDKYGTIRIGSDKYGTALAHMFAWWDLHDTYGARTTYNGTYVYNLGYRINVVNHYLSHDMRGELQLRSGPAVVVVDQKKLEGS